MVSDAEGAELVRIARMAVQHYLDMQEVFEADKAGPLSGVFVTLNYLARNVERLRGCIGFPRGYKPLYESVVEAAIAAATQDPRFPPVVSRELDKILFEVSVLTEPVEMPERKDIRLGRDGLILRWKNGSGLLLPQVPVGLGWDVEEYLANLCYKAGAPLDALSDPSSKLYRFHAEVFKEHSPGGAVTRLGQYK